MRKWSVPFMPIFAVTVTFAGVDWIMSLEPKWFSTIFGVYIFSGMLRRRAGGDHAAGPGAGAIRAIRPGPDHRDHLYNLGALQFAFTCFWAYIAFSQYMLIWYGNMPEETFYLVRSAGRRLAGREHCPGGGAVCGSVPGCCCRAGPRWTGGCSGGCLSLFWPGSCWICTG